MRHNLPAEVASFVGRRQEVAEIGRAVQGSRLVTLTGTGGCGKTRLALHAAADLLPGFADGVWLVTLAPIADSSLVPRAVAAALGIRGTPGRPLAATLATALAPRRLLLLLDNCEHVIGACARLVETLLQAAPHLRILATSREPLRVPGETVRRVPALAIPAGVMQATPETLAAVESVALFLDRARARWPDFALTGEIAPSVAAICRQLEGLPLGIELAAAQIGALSPAQIASRLDDALRLLEGGARTVPRQETLVAALDWSYALLSPMEQTLFRRVAVFAGSFDLAAMEHVCAAEGVEPADMPLLLRTLVEKSLLEAHVGSEEARYRLLEPVRQYARARLIEHGESVALQRRHAGYFAELAETAEPFIMSGQRGPWMDRLTHEQDNLRAALTWSRQANDARDREIGLRLAAALVFFWNLLGETSEGLSWIEDVLARAPDASPAARAKALWGAAELAWLAGRNSIALRWAEEAESLWRALGDKRWLAYTLQSLPMSTDHPRARELVAESLRLFAEVGDAWGMALAVGAADLFPLLHEGDPTGEGRSRLEEGLSLAREQGDAWLTAQRLNFLGDLARSQEDLETATACYQEALDLLRGQDLSGTVPSLLHNLGHLALQRGENRRALRLFRESLALFRDQGDQRGIADCLEGLAGVLVAMRQAEGAARLLGAADTLRRVTEAAVWPANQPAYDRTLAAASGQLDNAALSAARTAGRALSLEQAVAEVLGKSTSDGLSDAAGDADLTPRELEVAALLARGLTNRQIGAALVITEGTARLHVKHILQKLGFTSRAQIAAWAVERGLATVAGRP